MRNLGSHQRYSALSIDCPAKFLVPQLMAGVQLQFQPDLDRAELLLAIGVNTVVSHGHGVMVPNPLGHLRDVRARGGRARRDRSPPLGERPPRRPPRGAAPGHRPVRRRPPRARGAARAAATPAFLDACADAASVRAARRRVDAVRRRHGRGDRRRARGGPAGARRAGRRRRPRRHRDRHRRDDEPPRQPHRVAGVGARRGHRQPRPARRRDVQPRLAAPLRGRRARRARRPRSAAGEPARPAARSSTARCRAPRSPTRSAAGHVRALLVRVGNPALAIAGQPAPARRARPRSTCSSPSTSARPRPTAVATHVLPMTDHFERGDLLSGYLQAQPFLRYAPPVLAPVGERRPQWWVFAELARRLGLPMFGSARRDAALDGRDVDDEVVAESIMAQRPAAVGRGPRRAARRPRRLGGAGLARAGAPPAPPRPGPGRARRPARRVPSRAAAGRRAALVLINRRTPQQYNSLHREVVGRGRPATPSLLMHPDDAASARPGHRRRRRDQHRQRLVPRRRRGHRRDPARRRLAAPRLRRRQRQPLTSTADADPLSGMTIVSGLRSTSPAPARHDARVGVAPLDDPGHPDVDELDDLGLRREDVEAVLADAVEDLLGDDVGRVPGLQRGREAGGELLQLVAHRRDVGPRSEVVGRLRSASRIRVLIRPGAHDRRRQRAPISRRSR